MRSPIVALALSLVSLSALAQSEQAVEIESRGQKIRAILLEPANPVGSVILLAGGHGRLDISPAGQIGWGKGNQLVRTRAAYARAGFATLVPDIAPDLKTAGGGVKSGYRFSAEHGRDIGALVAYMRVKKAPVTLVATSRGAVSAGAAMAVATGVARPDALVLTSPMLMQIDERAPSFQKAIHNDPDRARLPLLVVGHKKDACLYTKASIIDRFKAWMGGRLDVVMLDGPAGQGDPCEAESAHGFAGIDAVVVETVSGWIKKHQ
jgi:hypothetical protein